MSIGFRSNPVHRVPYYTTSGQRIGYLLRRNGHDYIQNNEGEIKARILTWKKWGPVPEVSPCGGSFVYPDR